MNKRIQELFEQAHIQPERIVGEYVQWTPPKQFSVERFAELIVRESAIIAAQQVYECSGVTYGVEQLILNEFGFKQIR